MPMVLGKARQVGAFLIKYYDRHVEKMPVRDGEWFLGSLSKRSNVWISPFTGKEIDHSAALFLSLRVGMKEDDIELCKAVYPPQKVLKLIEVFKLYTNGFAAIGRTESLRALWRQIKDLIYKSEKEAFSSSPA